MKLVIQIPCHNEQDNIGAVLESIPQKISEIDEIETIVLDDGSNDNTAEIASRFGVKVVSSIKKEGLSSTFKKGVECALKNKADILVNLDGDNQYKASDIEKIIKPILDNKADIVVGTRPVNKIKNFSLFKKLFQHLGSYMVKLISGVDIKDAPSGFRAYNRKSLLNINIFNPFTYTVESIVQSKVKKLTVENVDIEVNEQKNRKSKLFKNDFDYIFKQSKNLIRFFIIYRPARFFSSFGLLFLTPGILLGLRFLYYSKGHIQSLILCAILLSLSFVCFALAIIGDLLSINRKLLEEIRFELRNEKYKK